MFNESESALINLLERVLGKGEKKSRGNIAFKCPNNCHSSKKKLEINITTQNYSCWICGKTEKMAGKSIRSLFKRIGVNDEYLNELKLISPTKGKQQEYNQDQISLPKEFTPLMDLCFVGNRRSLQSIYAHQALNYLNNRGISNIDIIKYNIGICLTGRYENRIIIPSYDSNGLLNYFIGRDFTNSQSSHKKPLQKNHEIIGMELYVNWDLPIVLCEGLFDFLTIKRNAIPLFGKNISNALMKKIVTSQVKKIYLALDKDALKDSLKYCEQLIQMGKEVYMCELDGKDINEIGFKHFLEILENTNPLTFQDLINKKLGL